MTDIFISHAREDDAKIEKLSAALAAEGFSVWWDRQIAGGTDFSKETEAKLGEAKAILVAWSKASVGSMWVADEATVGRDKGNLVPVVLDEVEPKIGFRQLQTIDFRNWRGNRTAPEFENLIRALKARVADEALPPPHRATPTLAGRLRQHKVALVAASVLAAAVVGVGGVLVGPANNPPSAPKAEGVGLAVIPFTNLSSDPEQEHFADGLTEELLNWLGNVEGLRVPGRTSSFQFKGKADDLRAIGERLAVDYLLEGSVRRSGESLRITAQLIDARTGYHRWSAAYDRKLADIFAIQDEIARIVVTELLGEIPETGAANPAAVGDVDPRAHEIYLEGRALWTARAPGALEKFRAAVAIDPHHALAQAYSAVIAAYFVANDFALPGVDNPDVAITRALAEAVRLQPKAADVLFAKAWVAEMRSGTAGSFITDRSIVDAYEAAVRANPRHVEALHALTRAEPSPEKRIALFERILKIDPGLIAARGNLASTYQEIGDRANAQLVIRQALVAAPDERSSWAARAKFLGDLPLFGEAVFGDWAAFDRDGYLRSIAASLLADLGAVEEARYLSLKEATEGDPRWREYLRVAVTALDGDADAELAAAEAFHRGEGAEQYSAWMLANALIKTGDYAGAYDMLARRRPDIAEAKVEQEFRDWDQFADLEFVTAAHALNLAGRRAEARTLWSGALSRADAVPKSAGWGWMDFLYLTLLESRAGDASDAANSFRAAYDAGFRYLASYNCSDCIYDGFSAERGLFAELVKIPKAAALVEKIKAENATSLEDFNARYGVLDRVHQMMAADAAEREAP